MSDEEPTTNRRSVLGTIGAAGLGLPAVGTAQAAGPDRVPVGQARKAAERTVQKATRRPETFGEWEGATVGEPTLFHARNAGPGPAYLPSAYVFTVRKNGRDVGYVTCGGNDAWSSVIEYSPATPPQRQVPTAKATARDNGAEPTERLLYHGGVKYGLELADGRAVNVRNGRPAPVGTGVDFSQVDPDGGRSAADVSDGGVDAARTTTADEYDRLWAVPEWTERDTDDSWDNWDGCTPVAGSMIVAYHEGISEYDDDADFYREWYIDELHRDMNTSDDGWTTWWDIDDGFDTFAEGSNSYDGTNIYVWTHPNFLRSEISDHQRPFLLNVQDGGQADDRSQNYGDHSVCVMGYDEYGEEFVLADGWDDYSHHFDWGNWSTCMYTKVTVS